MLSLGVSHLYFLWMWHFGTLGALFSSAMLIPVLALSYRAAVLHKCSLSLFLGLWVCVFLMCMWMPLALTIGAGLVLAYVLMKKEWDRKSFIFLAACAGVFFISWAPWLKIILFPARGVVDYVGQPPPTQLSHLRWLGGGWENLLKMLADANPLILLLGLGAALYPPGGAIKRWYFPSALVLAFFTGWISFLKPLSQFHRLSVPFLFVLLIPASLLFAEWMKRPTAGSGSGHTPGSGAVCSAKNC